VNAAAATLNLAGRIHLYDLTATTGDGERIVPTASPSGFAGELMVRWSC
jgi:hypothetical protein